MALKKWLNIKSLQPWIKPSIYAILFLLFFKNCCFEAYFIESSSMEKSVLTGDYILVNKLSYGPRLPKTILSTPFVSQHMYLGFLQLPYLRLFGSPDVERYDVVVFNFPLEDEHPIDHRTVYTKRCVGLPGDSLKIINGEVFINNKLMDESQNVQYNYTVNTVKNGLDSTFLSKYDITEGGLISEKGDYSYTLTRNMAERVANHKNVYGLKRNTEKIDMYDETTFPKNDNYLWNVDQISGIYIPKKGDTLNLDSINIFLYERIIKNYEGNDLVIKDNKISINGDTTNKYIVELNYYYVMGDNRHNSIDSRHWGFLPESHIIGKATRVLWSRDKAKSETRWGRFFSSIH